MNIDEIIENIEKMFSKRFFDVIKYDNSKIICKKNDFDLRIIDYIKNTFNVTVEFEFDYINNLEIIIIKIK